jgi:hypothetical protein
MDARRSCRVVSLHCLLAVLAASAAAQDFWAHWGDGRAEMNGYRATVPRYGAKRAGTDVLIFVTEDMSDSLRVKADPGRHPASDVYPVMKLNAVRHFQTGIYDYEVMTSTFARVAPGWPVRKISFSSQEWCGHVYHQLLPKQDKVPGVFHSYFDGEADGTEDLPFPAGGVFEDELPIRLRGWNGAYLKAGEKKTVPFLPSLYRSRLEHKPLAWTKAVISRSGSVSPATVPAGKYTVVTWIVAVDGGPKWTFEIEAEPPYRLVRKASSDGDESVLLGSTRLAYWKLNGPGGEKHLKEMGLKVP